MTHLAPTPRSRVRAAPVGASFPLPRDLSAPRLARAALRELMASRGWSQTYEGELVVSELVANAVFHGVGQITLGLWLAEGRIHGVVTAQGNGLQPPAAHGDNGLVAAHPVGFIDALTDRWGYDDRDSHVWFELPAR